MFINIAMLRLRSSDFATKKLAFLCKHPNTSNFVKNIPLRVIHVFSTLFSVFGYPDETLSLVFDKLRLPG